MPTAQHDLAKRLFALAIRIARGDKIKRDDKDFVIAAGQHLVRLETTIDHIEKQLELLRHNAGLAAETLYEDERGGSGGS